MLNSYAFSLAFKRSWERQSNAFDRSVRCAPNIFLLSIADFNFSNIDNRQCWALNSFLNSHWYFDKKRFKIFRHLLLRSSYCQACLSWIFLVRKVSVRDVPGRGYICQAFVWLGNCPSGMCLVGEVSIGNVFVRGNVLRASVRWRSVLESLKDDPSEQLLMTGFEIILLKQKIRRNIQQKNVDCWVGM